jgi:hypothetical protein
MDRGHKSNHRSKRMGISFGFSAFMNYCILILSALVMLPVKSADIDAALEAALSPNLAGVLQVVDTSLGWSQVNNKKLNIEGKTIPACLIGRCDISKRQILFSKTSELLESDLLSEIRETDDEVEAIQNQSFAQVPLLGGIKPDLQYNNFSNNATAPYPSNNTQSRPLGMKEAERKGCNINPPYILAAFHQAGNIAKVSTKYHPQI